MSSLDEPTFSIIIPACDEEHYLPLCMDAIDAATAQLGEPVEVIVVDNLSRDRTADIARERGARVVEEPAKCLSKVRNRGAAEARGQYLAFIDADSYMSADMLVHIKCAMATGRYVGGGIVGARTDRISLGIAAHLLLLLPWLLWLRITGVMFYTRPEHFHAIGGFNEERLTVEDIDFALRLHAHGRTRGLRFKNLWRGRVITSARKFDEFGDWYMFRNPRMLIRALRNDAEAAYTIWYRPRR